jgi:hypothetical protein
VPAPASTPGTRPSKQADKPNPPRKPTTPSAPSSPAKPSEPTPGGGTTTPEPTPTTPAQRVTRVEEAGSGKLTSVTGERFTGRVKVRAENAIGVGLPQVELRFEIVGDTDTRFSGGRAKAVVMTGTGGVATAPVLEAGEKTGDFTVRVTVVGRDVRGPDHTATVTARRADALARTGDKELSAAPGTVFADEIEVAATLDGAAAAGVAVTATMITDSDKPVENTEGPYFEDAKGKPVRTLGGLRTGADGTLVLPEVHAGDRTGTFLLRLTTAGGATLTVELKVATPDTGEAPEPGTTPLPDTTPVPGAVRDSLG